MPAQTQDHLFNSPLAGRPSKKHEQDANDLGITHLCCKFGGMAAEEHTEAVARQSQFDIQGIIPAANAIYISAPIAHFAKERSQNTVFPRLALVTGNRGDNDIFFTRTQKQGRKESAQTKDPGNEFFLKFEKVQGAAINDPLNNIINNLNNFVANIIDRRGGCKFNGYLGVGGQAQIFFVIIWEMLLSLQFLEQNIHNSSNFVLQKMKLTHIFLGDKSICAQIRKA